MKRVGKRDGEGIEVFIPVTGLIVLLGNVPVPGVSIAKRVGERDGEGLGVSIPFEPSF